VSRSYSTTIALLASAVAILVAVSPALAVEPDADSPRASPPRVESRHAAHKAVRNWLKQPTKDLHTLLSAPLEARAQHLAGGTTTVVLQQCVAALRQIRQIRQQRDELGRATGIRRIKEWLEEQWTRARVSLFERRTSRLFSTVVKGVQDGVLTNDLENLLLAQGNNKEDKKDFLSDSHELGILGQWQPTDLRDLVERGRAKQRALLRRMHGFLRGPYVRRNLKTAGSPEVQQDLVAQVSKIREAVDPEGDPTPSLSFWEWLAGDGSKAPDALYARLAENLPDARKLAEFMENMSLASNPVTAEMARMFGPHRPVGASLNAFGR